MRLAILIGLAACHPDAAPATPSNRAPASDYAATAADVLGFLPVNSEIVVGFDASQTRQSAVWKQLEPKILHGLGSDLTDFQTKCGFDPVQTLTRITAGISSPDEDRYAGVVVVRGVVGTHLLDCLQAEAAQHGDATQDRGVLVTHKNRGGFASASIIIGGDTLVMQFGPDTTRTTLDQVLASGVPLRGSPAFLAVFDRLERGASVWGVMNGASKWAKRFGNLGIEPRTIDGTIRLSEQIVIAGRMVLETPDQATTFATMAASSLAAGKAMLDRLDISSAGPVVKLDVALTAAQLQQLVAMLGFGP